MKRFIKEISILLIQLFVFYILPKQMGNIGALGMVFLLLLIAFILSIIIGIISKEKIKYLYPIIVSILFIPSIFVYYNESALIHSIWYMVISFIGLVLGTGIYKLTYKK